MSKMQEGQSGHLSPTASFCALVGLLCSVLVCITAVVTIGQRAESFSIRVRADDFLVSHHPGGGIIHLWGGGGGGDSQAHQQRNRKLAHKP